MLRGTEFYSVCSLTDGGGDTVTGADWRTHAVCACACIAAGCCVVLDASRKARTGSVACRELTAPKV